MGRFGHFLLGFVSGVVAFRYFSSDTQNGFWLIALVSVCLAAELLYAFRALDKWIVDLLAASRPQKQE